MTARRDGMHEAVIDVAVSIVVDGDGRVLMAERTARQISAGYWELPGGKIDAGESAQAAAARELEEEIGIRPSKLRPCLSYEHRFPLRRVRLHFFRIEGWTGTPHGREGQRLAWIDPSRPAVAPILPSNDRVLRALALPPLYTIACSRDAGGPQALLAALEASQPGAVRLIQVREPGMAPDQRVAHARRVNAVATRRGAQVLMTGSALEACRAGVAGIHSRSGELRRLQARPPVKLWLASCRDAGDLRRAVALGADAAVISPVLPCSEHPDETALGWEGLRELASQSPIPLYAQGGMTGQWIAEAQAAGAIGVAVRYRPPAEK